MRLYQLCALTILFLQSFLCIGMHETVLDFPQPTGKKLPFPEPYRQQLIDYCNKKREKGEIIPSSKQCTIEGSQLIQEVQGIQKTNLALVARSTILSNELKKTHEEIKVLEKKIAFVKKEKANIIKGNKQISTKTIVFQQKQPVQSKELTTKEKLHALRTLKKQYHVKELPQLIEALCDDADSAYHNNEPGFDKKHHFLLRKINQNYRVLFCSCTRQWMIVDNGKAIPLPVDFECGIKCSFYDSKQSSSSTNDTSIDSSTEIETESDSDEGYLQPIFLTKAQIEKIAD